MTVRLRLPDRRASTTFDFELAGLRYTATTSNFPDGRLGEIFLNNHKSGSGADTAARDASIAASLALQHGANVETLRRSLSRDSYGRPCGPLAAALDIISQEDAS
jgi:hypothetical protein